MDQQEIKCWKEDLDIWSRDVCGLSGGPLGKVNKRSNLRHVEPSTHNVMSVNVLIVNVRRPNSSVLLFYSFRCSILSFGEPWDKLG